MERLTQRYETHISTDCNKCKRKGKCCDSQNCAEILRERLAAYEDTGLTPEEVIALEAKYRNVSSRQGSLEEECDNTHLELSNLRLEHESCQLLLKNAKASLCEACRELAQARNNVCG